MDGRRIEVRRILSKNAPTIRVRISYSRRLRRAVGQGLRVLSAIIRAIVGLFPKKAYLVLE